MKKFNSILVVAMGMAALTVSCKQEGLEPVAPEEGQTIKVEVSLGETLKGTFTDREGLRWEVGDQLKYAGDANFTSSHLAAEDITDEGSVASFTFPADLTSVDRNGWFVSTNNHPTNNDEVEYTLGVDGGNVYTQDNAGEMNHRRLFLHSGLTTMNIAKGQEKITVKMEICGTILRAMPYTKMYNDETVQSVSLESNSYIVGTVVYNRGGEGSYIPIAGNDYTGNSKDWMKCKNVIVNLGNAFSLSGVVDKKTSKGIYIPIAASYEGFPYNGYKYVVTTDKAQYVFDAMNETLAAGENVVKNVYLNLDRATRQEHALGVLRYDAHLDNVTVPASESADKYCGYSVAMTKDGEEAEVKREGTEYYDLYYKNVKFTCTDPDSKEPVDWVSVRYNTANAHVLANVSANTGAERKALVTITYSDVRNYVIEETSKTKTFTITQKAAGSTKVLDFQNGIGDTVIDPEEKETDLNWYAIRVDGQTIEGSDARYDELYGNATFTAYVGGVGSEVADWLTVSYKPKSTWVAVKAQKNVGAERKALVYCEFKAPEGYEFKDKIDGYKDKTTCYMQFFVTQKSGMVVTASFDGVYSGLVPAAGETIAAANLKVEVNGTAVSDYTKLSEYGLSLSASAGTVSVAADGKVTLVVPENKPNKEKTYTISLKQESKVIASCKIKQEAGDGSGAVGHTYSYNIFNDKPDGSKDTGFGPGKGFVGNYYRIENVTIDGKTYQPGDDMKNLVNDTELINALTSHIFSFGEITESDVQVSGTDPLTTDPETFVELVPWTDGGAAIYFGIVFKNENTTGARRTFKVITKDGEGKVTSTIVYFQNA